MRRSGRSKLCGDRLSSIFWRSDSTSLPVRPSSRSATVLETRRAGSVAMRQALEVIIRAGLTEVRPRDDDGSGSAVVAGVAQLGGEGGLRTSLPAERIVFADGHVAQEHHHLVFDV